MLNHQMSRLAPRGVAWLAASLALAAGSAHAQVSVTSLEGDLSSGGHSLSLHSELPAGQTVELGEDARGAFLLADDKLVRLCDGARASFEAARGGETARVELSRGQLAATVAPAKGESPLTIDTPSARIEMLGSSLHLALSRDGGATLVSSLDGPMRVRPRTGSASDFVEIDTGERLAVKAGAPLGKPARFETNALTTSSDCLGSEMHRASAVAASARMRLTEAPPVSAGPEDVNPYSSEFAQIAGADYPTDGILLEAASTPSALIAELNKGGLDEEVCDPITCNPPFQLPPPEICGIPPVTGCIPGP